MGFVRKTRNQHKQHYSGITMRVRRSFEVGIGFVEASGPGAGALSQYETPLRYERAQHRGVADRKRGRHTKNVYYTS